MTRRIVASDARRMSSSRRGSCAPAALVGMLLALAPAASGQDLQLQPATVDAESVHGQQESSPPEPGPDEVQAAAAAERPTQANARRSAAAPAPVAAADLRVALGKPGNLHLHEVELRAALFMISEQWGINIVAGEVKGSINGVFRQAPLREILDSILLSNGYNYRAVGESLVISSVKDLGQINPFFQSATIPVRAADIDEVVQGARLLTTPQGQVQAIKSARSIVVLDFPDRVKMIREFVTTVDTATQMSVGGAARAMQPLEVGYFRTQHIAAKTAEDALQAVLSKDGRVAIMEKEDRLLVSDYAENLAMVEKVLRQIDRPRPQVRITSLIYDISLEDVEQLGINWNSLAHDRPDANGEVQSLFEIDSLMQVPFDADEPGGTLTFFNLSPHFDLNAVALLLENANDARLLADPHVAVLENEEAVFQSISEIPYQQLTQTAAGGQIGTTAFRDAGITLRVVPKIASDGTIRMNVTPEFSRLTGFTPGDNQPIIDRRIASTTLSVRNRQTVIIGGLRQRSDIGDFKGVPFLKDMRVVGKLFRSRDTAVRESELVVFISPEIIGTCEPLNQREALIVDTIGCRLNQIPEAEGCPPPCQCAPTMPLRLPEPELDYAEELPPMATIGTSAPPLAVPGEPGGPPPRPTPGGGHHRAAMAAHRPGSRTTRLADDSGPRSPVRRLPTVDREVAATSAVPQSSPLFGAPPSPVDSSPQFVPPRIGVGSSRDSQPRR